MATVPPIQPSPQVLFVKGHMLRVSGLSDEHASHVRKALTIANPELTMKRQFSGWVDKSLPKYLTGYLDMDGDIMVAPGFGHALWDMCVRWGYSPEFSRHGCGLYTDQAFGWFYSGTARSEQRGAVQDLLERRTSMCIAPCGSGKTDIAIQVICRRGVNTLILVHTRELVDQWEARILERMGVKAKILKSIKPPKKPLTGEVIIIATVQFLMRHGHMLKELSTHRDMVITDECDFAPRMTFEGVLARLDPYYRHGFTATETRDDGLHPLMHWWIGPVVTRIGRDSLEAHGRIIRPRLVCRPLRMFADTFRSDQPGEYGKVIKRLEAHGGRLNAIASDIAVEFKAAGGVHLVLVAHIDYLILLMHQVGLRLDMLGVKDCNIAAIVGPMGKRARREVLADVRSGKVKILFATSLADRGLDLDLLTHGWKVSPSRSSAKTEQQIGRVCRALAGKAQPVFTVYVDTEVEGLRVDPQTKETRLSRTMINQFRHLLTRVFRKVCDVDEKQVKESLRVL